MLFRSLDVDGDSYGSSAFTLDSCTQPAGYVSPRNGVDCNDTDADISPGAPEICDAANTDEDCDGRADDFDPGATGQTTWYGDTDGDGYGGTTGALACDQPSGYVAANNDCNDTDPAISPAATEVCDPANTDEDCDGLADDADPGATGRTPWYHDVDGDGYGGAATTSACDPPSGYLPSSTDCDDSNAAVSPSATEVCDAANTDEDCDGLADDADPGATGQTTWYRDADGDGHGGAATTSACDPPSGYLPSSTDCDDSNAEIGRAHV